jgi:hypothetical protein
MKNGRSFMAWRRLGRLDVAPGRSGAAPAGGWAGRWRGSGQSLRGRWSRPGGVREARRVPGATELERAGLGRGALGHGVARSARDAAVGSRASLRTWLLARQGRRQGEGATGWGPAREWERSSWRRRLLAGSAHGWLGLGTRPATSWAKWAD